jgi:hypothetical protein
MAARIFFPGIFLCTNFFWEFSPPLPGFLMVRPLERDFSFGQNHFNYAQLIGLMAFPFPSVDKIFII